MEDYDKLMVGDQSTDGRIIIADKDRLCYLVKSYLFEQLLPARCS